MNTPNGGDAEERRNFILNIFEGAIFLAGAAMISPQTVLPALVARLGGGNVAIGALGVIVYLGQSLPQFFAARHIEQLPWKKPWVVGFGFFHRLMVLFVGLVILIFGASHPWIALWGFFLFFSASQVLIGITIPGWFDIFAKLSPVSRRGRLIGIRNSGGGAGGLLCGLIMAWLLDALQFPANFAVVIFIAYFLQMVSLGIQSRLIESSPSAVVHPKPFATFLQTLPGVLRNNVQFREFLVATVVLVVATMPVGFYTVYALKRFDADPGAVGRFTLTMVAIQVVSALAMGYLSDRYGNRTVLLVSAGSLLCATAWALLAPSLAWFTLVFLFLGVNLGSETMARYNMTIEYGPVEQRSTYVGMLGAVLAPFYLSGIAGGYISDAFGYGAVFVVGGLFSLLGIFLLYSRVHDPRPAV